MVTEARNQGYTRIDTLAIGSPESKNNGYYTWARFGFDGKIDDTMKKKVYQELGVEAETVQDIIASPNGLEWWRKNGSDIELSFDLSDKSESMKMWKKYKEGKKFNS